MSEENVEIFKRGVELWNRDDFDAWIEQYDPEVEWFALMEVYRGRAGVRQAWESFKGDMHITVRFGDIRDLGESVLALGEIKGTGHTTGLNFTGELAQLVTYRDGRTIRVRDFASHAEGLEAAGLSGVVLWTKSRTLPRDTAWAMSQENIEVARRFQDHFERTGEPLWDVIDSEIEVYDHDIPDAGTYHGLAGFTEWLTNWGESFENSTMELERLVDAGDQVVSLIVMRATGRGSGVSVERKDGIVSTFQDGKITRIDWYNDQAQALEAAGLSE